MNRLSFSYSCIAVLILISCKDQISENSNNSIDPFTPITTSDSFSSELSNTDSLVSTTQNIVEEIEVPEIIYTPFSPSIAMKRLGLLDAYREKSISTLLNSVLRKGDSLRPFVLQTGDGTFDTYALSIKGEDAVLFYYEKDDINSIEIISSKGGPSRMIRPGLAFENLRKTYKDPVAYGSEIEARVFVFMDSVSFRLATNYGVYEPIDVEDDTEIVSIQF